MGHSLLLLKLRILLQTLDQVPNCELHAIIIQQANLAHAKAAQTAFPELLLPCLFEELTAAALQQEQRRQNRYWRLGFAPNRIAG